MTETQFNDLMSMLNDMRADTVLVRSDLLTIETSLQALDITSLSSTYPATTTVGVMDLRVEHTATVGDLLVSSLLGISLCLVLGKYAFNAIRGIGL